MPVIDFHAHAFPDFLAEKAVTVLGANASMTPETNGTASALVELLDRHGVDRAVVASIATRPSQSPAIIEWSRGIASDRLIPFGSVHPDSEDVVADVRAVARAGLRGIKLHPLYQEFRADDERVFLLYEAMEEEGLVLLMHAGFDIAFDEEDEASPERFPVVLERFPRLKMVLAHLGGWKRWALFLEHVAGRDVWIDTSFARGYISEDQMGEILERHGTDRIVFGSDSPWGRMGEQMAFVEELPVDDAARGAILGGNAASLLGLAGGGSVAD